LFLRRVSHNMSTKDKESLGTKIRNKTARRKDTPALPAELKKEKEERKSRKRRSHSELESFLQSSGNTS
jgi:hypothetical protein